MNEPTPAPTATITPAPPVAPAEFSHGGAQITPSEAATMAEWAKQDLLSGKITQAQADQQFTELNVPIEQRGPDVRTDEQRLVDAHFPAAKPEDYLIRYASPGQPAVEISPQMNQFDQSARTWLSGAEFPRELGNSLVTTIERVAQTTKHMDDKQLEQYSYAEFAKLERAFGDEDKLQEKLRAAAVMIDAFDKKQPGLKNLLRSKGIGDNALVVAQIIGQSERWHARRGR